MADQKPQDDKKKDDPMAEMKKKIEDAKKKEHQASEDQRHQELERIQGQINILDTKVAAAEAKTLRALADLANAQKRMEAEKSSFSTFAAMGVVVSVIEIFENFEKLIAHTPKDIPESEWLKGLHLVSKQFQAFLDQQGVKSLAVKVGDRADPAKHEIMMTGEGPEGEVIEVFHQGYEMGGRIIRAAKVRVGKGK